jgi:hypothetical protein
VDEERERMTPAFNNRVKIDSMRNTQKAGAKNNNNDTGGANVFKQVTLTVH